MRTFCAQSDGMAPAKAAAEWLALLDEAIALPHRSLHGMLGGALPQPVGTLYNVLLTLPRPEVWPEIQAIVSKRPPSQDRTALLMLCARLNGDDQEVLRLCDDYDRQKPTQPTGADPTTTGTIRIGAILRLGQALSPPIVEKEFEAYRADVPRLTDILSRAQARELLLHCLTSGSYFDLRNPENLKLAQDVALEHLPEIKSAPWLLVQGMHDASFVRRLVAHYGFAALFDQNGWGAPVQQIYFTDLAIQGKLDEAVKLLTAAQNIPQLSPSDWGQAKNADGFVLRLQARLPHKDLVNMFVSASIAAGHTGAARSRLRSQIGDPTTPRDRKLSELGSLFSLDAAVGDSHALSSDCQLAKRLKPSASEPDPGYGILGVGLASGNQHLIDLGIEHDLAGPTPTRNWLRSASRY